MARANDHREMGRIRMTNHTEHLVNGDLEVQIFLELNVPQQCLSHQEYVIWYFLAVYQVIKNI